MIKQLEIIKDEIENNSVFKDKGLDTINWNEINSITERQFIENLGKNKEDKDIIELEQHPRNEYESNQKSQFYFTKRIEDFLSLSNEDKYIIVNSYNNSYNYKITFYNLSSNYNSLKQSYDKGIKKDNLNKNPNQYAKDHEEIIIYDEKVEKMKSKNQNEPKSKNIIISNFKDNIELSDLLSFQEENDSDAEN